MARWTLRIRVGADVVGVRGWQARELLEKAGLKPLWLGTTREQTVDRRHAADVIAVLEHCGAAIVIEGEDVTRELIEKRVDPEPRQMAFDLFGGGAA